MGATQMDKKTAIHSSTEIRSEWAFVFGTIAVILILTSLPYIFGFLSTPADKQFMGIMLDVPDHLQYFSWMHELTNANLAANKLTPEANKPVFFNLLWWGLGRSGKILGLGYAEMYQILRLVAGTLFLLLVYRMCSWFFEDRLRRRTSFLIVAFTSGFGWVLVLLKYFLTNGVLLFPLDVFVAEGNTFLGILGYPHFIAAALYIFVFDLILRGEVKGQLRYAVAAGLFALFLGWQHTYDLLTVYAIIAAYAFLLLLRDRRIPKYITLSGIIIGLISCWPAIYSVILTSADPIWKEVLAQFSNAGVFTPNLFHLPILMGPAFLLALFTLVKGNPFHLNVNNNEIFIRGWFLVTFIIIYLPVDYQIHLLNGWQVPIAFLATKGLFQYIAPFTERYTRRWGRHWKMESLQKALAVLLVVIILPTNIYLLVWRFVDLSRHDYPYYLYKDELSAMAWLKANAAPDDVVLSSLTIGQYIPAWTGSHAFLAHWAQTVDFYGKTEMVNSFYAANTDNNIRNAILKEYSVDYIFYGPAERQIGDFNPNSDQSLSLVYENPLVEVFRVTKIEQ